MEKIKRIIKKYFPCQSDRLFFLCGLLMLCSEVWKQLTLTFALGGGVYNWWYLPFQLCSIPMYILLLYPWLLRENVRRALLAFLMCYGLMGGIAAFTDQSGLHYPLPALTVHSYAWHVLLILTGIGAGAVYCRNLARKDHGTGTGRVLFSRVLSRAYPLRPFLHATALYLGCCLTAVILNLSLDHLGTINMFYINPDYQMQQIVFRDLVPLIGNTASIMLYVAASISGAFLLHLLWRCIFRLISRR